MSAPIKSALKKESAYGNDCAKLYEVNTTIGQFKARQLHADPRNKSQMGELDALSARTKKAITDHQYRPLGSTSAMHNMRMQCAAALSDRSVSVVSLASTSASRLSVDKQKLDARIQRLAEINFPGIPVDADPRSGSVSVGSVKRSPSERSANSQTATDSFSLESVLRSVSVNTSGSAMTTRSKKVSSSEEMVERFAEHLDIQK